KLVPFLRAIIGLSSKTPLFLGRPVPPGMHSWQALAVVHDRRLSAGIFTKPAKSKTAGCVYCLVTWKSFQDKAGRWHVSTALFPDEIDPALMLLQECRRRMAMTTTAAS